MVPTVTYSGLGANGMFIMGIALFSGFPIILTIFSTRLTVP